MSDMKSKLQPEDRAIDALNDIHWRLVEAIATIDRRVDYLERCKEIRKKVKSKEV